ncbi:uncharacterized protein BDZ99DRAFT_399140, partial [Mytilinidion resinicola]
VPLVLSNTTKVTENVKTILLHLRDREKFRWLWIDALANDQDDYWDRTIQVAQMPAAYVKARRTLIWLGESDHETESAFGCIRQQAIFESTPRVGEKFS